MHEDFWSYWDHELYLLTYLRVSRLEVDALGGRE